jgi:starch synthase (maltosyl-transferring)
VNQFRIVIENVTPSVDAGRFAVKVVAGDRVEVAADIWRDGHDLLRAAVLWRKLGADEQEPGPPRAPDLGKTWREARLHSAYEYNDRWYATIPLDEIGAHAFTVVAWTDVFGSWREELRKKHAARQAVASELLEGMAIIERTIARPAAAAPAKLIDELKARLAALRAAVGDAARVPLALDPTLVELIDRADPRLDLQAHAVELPIWVDRARARFGAWYEVFPRSQGTDPTRSATFREAEARLPAIAAMGFDVLYLTPIHPIGRTARKGPNNTETCKPGDPGSPWAIGGPEGGHTAVHPELGTLDDFDHYRAAAEKLGLEIALDFAVQCSPDHPWVKQHPAWFAHRPDGTIKYAENPPKKYQDIYPINFDTEDREGLWNGILEAVRFWIGHGVKIFRVDNPHTKPIGFWEWLIARVHRDHPDVLFLAEAFTRPKRMHALAKAGFTQSYTYFTWRNARAELEEYATELFTTEVKDYFRPNFFANTPDILHEYLQKGGRPAFIARLVLAAGLSPTYGIYNGFELCEATPVREGSEEYLDSEKYQIKVWDWDRPGNITPLVAQVNRVRREHRAFTRADNIQILQSSNPQIIAFAKTTADYDDVIVIAVNLDPRHPAEGMVRVPPELHGAGDYDTFGVTDLLTGTSYPWRGDWNYVRLDPQALPAHILRIERPEGDRHSPSNSSKPKGPR